jgi:hypothetical protein
VSEPDPRAGRPESDDYDLLTYGEASARLTELLATERDNLATLSRQSHPDPTRVSQLKQRIALLESSRARYRQQSLSGEDFVQRFGFTPRGDSGKDPR